MFLCYLQSPGHNRKTRMSSFWGVSSFPWLFTHTHPPTWPGIQSEDTIYTRVYSVFVQAFKARTNLCITHSKWGHFFTHLWICLARTKRGFRPYPPTPILWKSEDSAHSHKARTEILTSLCQNVLTLNVKKWFWSSLWMPGRTHTSSFARIYKCTQSSDKVLECTMQCIQSVHATSKPNSWQKYQPCNDHILALITVKRIAWMVPLVSNIFVQLSLITCLDIEYNKSLDH